MALHRASNDLDRLLDRLAAREEPEVTGNIALLLHPARAAGAVLRHAVPPERARDHLAMLRDDRARNVVIAPARARPRHRLAAVALVGTIVVALGSGSALAATAHALPGDRGYGIKIAAERIALAMHRDPIGRARLELRFAERRWAELQILIAAGRDTTEASNRYTDALAEASAEALHAQALGQNAEALLAHIQQEIGRHVARLQVVLTQVPPQAQDAIQQAIDNAEKSRSNIQHGQSEGHGRPADPGHSGGHGNSGNAPAHP